VPYYLGSYDTNYNIYKNVEILPKKSNEKIVKENIESSGIFYL
jgi:hypothetical protein